MLSITVDKEAPIVTLLPEGKLEENDFTTATRIIDPLIETRGKLTGIMIYTKDFAYWKDFAAFLKHMKFIKNHHKKVKRIAFVTDSIIGDIAEQITSHFVDTEVKHFPYTEKEAAKKWLFDNQSIVSGVKPTDSSQ